MFHHLPLWILLAFSWAACGTSLDFIETARPPHRLHARGPDRVEVFITGKPNRPFVELGIIESQQESLSLDEEREVVAKMRRFAGELGCDALVIFSGNDTTETRGGRDFTSSRTLKGYRGSCLVYTRWPSPGLPLATRAATSCIPNSTQLCYGPGGCRGGQRCTADGGSFTLCDCGGPGGPSAPGR